MHHTLPPLPEKAPGKNGFRYKPQYGVIVICRDEAEHMVMLTKLQSMGLKCKAVRV